MKAFSRLLASLIYTPARNSKLRLLKAYLAETPDPDRITLERSVGKAKRVVDKRPKSGAAS